jgi:hypothetical protein
MSVERHGPWAQTTSTPTRPTAPATPATETPGLVAGDTVNVALLDLISRAISDPGSILPRYCEEDDQPYETVAQWSARAVMAAAKIWQPRWVSPAAPADDEAAIERMAKAIRAADLRAAASNVAFWTPERLDEDWATNCGPEWQEKHRFQARAALAALREGKQQ